MPDTGLDRNHMLVMKKEIISCDVAGHVDYDFCSGI